MKTKPIIADPLNLDRAGIQSLRMAALFIHVGRCGLVGTTIPRMTKDLRIHPTTVDSHVRALRELGLVTEFARTNTKGKARHYCVTIKGWSVLTQQADFSMFQNAEGVVS